MATTRGNILKAIKTALITVTGLSEARVHIGAISPEKADGELRCMIWWRSDKGMRKDGSKYERKLRIIVGVLGRTDASSAETDLIQIGELYDAVHAKLEQIADTAVSGARANWTEVEPGIQPIGFDLKDKSFYVSCEWEIHYDRARASV